MTNFEIIPGAKEAESINWTASVACETYAPRTTNGTNSRSTDGEKEQPVAPAGQPSDRIKGQQEQPKTDLEKAFDLLNQIWDRQGLPKNEISEGEVAARKQVDAAADLVKAGKFEDLLKIANDLRKVGENGEGLGHFQKMLSEKLNAQITFGKDSVTIGETSKPGDVQSKSITLKFEKDSNGKVTPQATESTTGGLTNPKDVPLTTAQDRIKDILAGKRLK